MTALLIILTGLLVLVNAFFVDRRVLARALAQGRLRGDGRGGQARGEARAVQQIDEIGDYISACQVGITMASIAIGALGEPAIAHALEPLLGGVIGHGGGRHLAW